VVVVGLAGGAKGAVQRASSSHIPALCTLHIELPTVAGVSDSAGMTLFSVSRSDIAFEPNSDHSNLAVGSISQHTSSE
jgi:hypothetical protein